LTRGANFSFKAEYLMWEGLFKYHCAALKYNQRFEELRFKKDYSPSRMNKKD